MESIRYTRTCAVRRYHCLRRQSINYLHSKYNAQETHHAMSFKGEIAIIQLVNIDSSPKIAGDIFGHELSFPAICCRMSLSRRRRRGNGSSSISFTGYTDNEAFRDSKQNCLKLASRNSIDHWRDYSTTSLCRDWAGATRSFDHVSPSNPVAADDGRNSITLQQALPVDWLQEFRISQELAGSQQLGIPVDNPGNNDLAYRSTNVQGNCPSHGAC